MPQSCFLHDFLLIFSLVVFVTRKFIFDKCFADFFNSNFYVSVVVLNIRKIN